jgi:acetyltransferase-like isoleucine patch superfamily enzyme
MNNLRRSLRFDWPLHLTLLLTGWLPDNVVFLRLRGLMARPFLGRCGANLRLGRDVTFYNPAEIELGSNVYVAKGSWFMAGEKIRVGDGVLFGPYCVVVSSNHTRKDGSFRYGPPEHAPISIGSGSWLAAHVTVTAGSRVGEGSLVAANSVVVDEVPPGYIATGAPARPLRALDP